MLIAVCLTNSDGRLFFCCLLFFPGSLSHLLSDIQNLFLEVLFFNIHIAIVIIEIISFYCVNTANLQHYESCECSAYHRQEDGDYQGTKLHFRLSFGSTPVTGLGEDLLHTYTSIRVIS